MDYENLYKNALERARVWKEKSGMPADKQGILDDIFPELAESEDERIRKEIITFIATTPKQRNSHSKWLAWLEKQGEVESDNDDIEAEEKGIREAFNKIEDEKQCKQKPQRMISAEAKEAIYNKSTDKVEPKCEESKTKVFDALTPFEDKLYAFVAACEILTQPAQIEFIKEHSQELLDAAKEQIEKKHEEDTELIKGMLQELNKKTFEPPFDIKTPEKIYLATTKGVQNLDTSFVGIAHSDPQDIVEPIEYIRTDAFIDKALKFLDGCIPDYIDLKHANVDTFIDVDNERLINDFKNYMKGG